MFDKEIFFNENTFKLPIAFLKNKTQVLENLKRDLELVETINPETKPMYEYIFNPTTELGKKAIPSFSEYYTTDTSFLKDSQKLYQNMTEFPFDKPLINNMLDSWREIKNETNFIEKYQYIDWEKIKWLNKSTTFLSVLSFYNISAPVLQLIAPFFVLLLPFAVLRVMKLPITWKTYYKILMENIRNHAIGKLIFSFNNVSLGQKMYILFALGMYFYNIYQNIISCYRFYKNSYYISSKFELINKYLDYTIEKMKLYKHNTKNYSSYRSFNNELQQNIEKLTNLHNLMKSLPKNTDHTAKIMYVGKLMKYFYMLYDSEEFENMIHYSFGFHGYIDCILGINENIRQKKLRKCYYKKNLTFKVKNMYHPVIENPVKNNIDIKKNIIITGPNAAGKTTTIKATIINLLITQQLGLGFFDSCQTSTFDYIHCYLNIPDSCSRDSLFQAEARRCRDILTSIQNNPKKRHFCIFDELYSGTNPYEAISSAYSYLKFISKNKNVRFLLTTHYIKLCHLFKDEQTIINKSMKTTIKNNNPVYTYKITKGVSEVKGGVSVLKQLNYPNQIIESTMNVLEKM